MGIDCGLSMENTTKKGLLYGTLGMVAESILPIISNSRPEALDPVYFAWFTLILESIFLLPLMMIEKRRYGNKLTTEMKELEKHLPPVDDFSTQKQFPAKKQKWFIFRTNLLIAVIFAVALILQYYALQFSGAILGSIILKSSIIYSTIIGWWFLREKVSKHHLFFTLTLLFGVVFSITNGFSTRLSMDRGGLLLALVPLLWMVGHYFTKILMRFNLGTPFQIVFWRVFVGAFLVGGFYLAAYPPSNFFLFATAVNLKFLLLGGLTYTAIHICWYKVLEYIDLSKSTVIYALTPITTSIFGVIFLQEPFLISYAIGIGVILISIYMIYKEE